MTFNCGLSRFSVLVWTMVISISLMPLLRCQQMNRPPYFVPGSGDMARFSLSENTPVDSPVYQLRGVDPEGGAIRYSISGPTFSVDRETGVVRLRQQLDREKQDTIEVILSMTDEGIDGAEPNTVSLRREIPVRDYNDNAPVFIGRPYATSISESTPVGSIIEVSPNIIVTDRDQGRNAEVTLSCFAEKDADVCETFRVETDRIGDGNFTTIITLEEPLDFESRPSYILTLLATDGAETNALSAMATISVNVVDVQDQPPVFNNAPYSATIEENMPADSSVLTIMAMDGDTGSPRPIWLELEDEPNGHFKLEPNGKPGQAVIYTTDIPIDREDSEILQNGGVYTFNVRATEYISNEMPGDSTVTQVTIVVTDVDDHLPEFNEQQFEVHVPENLERDTPLPGLSIYAIDKDMGANSRYNLSLKNVLNAENVFEVSPTWGIGRTPVVVKVVDPSKLDYDIADEALRTLSFDLVASVNGMDLSSTRVTVHLQDVNDNAPAFEQTAYTAHVKENSDVGTQIANISATDKDSGEFGKVTYILKGFGSENFETDRNSGGLFVKKNLDYEQQKSYSLSIVAIDGGGLETNANLFVDIEDVNDNAPEFESTEYTRTIREAATEFEPQFYVRAFDKDGPTQGGGNVTYSIVSENSISGRVFTVVPETGEIRIEKAVHSMDTERGQYELVLAATDFGTPSMKNTTRVLIRVGISGNQRPVFKGRFTGLDKGDIPGPPRYRVSIPENAEPGTNLTTVSATDPDGLDSLISYRIVGANDNFVIDEKTGLVQVSTVARLDRDTNPKQYSVIINAVDAGFPIPETATTTLYVQIDDVNDKPPKFIPPSYTAYISERTEVGAEVLKTTAADTDLDANIVYSIVEPIRAASKTGIQLTSIAPYDYRSAFRIDNSTGQIYVNRTLNHDLAAVIILTVKATDSNAAYNVDQQFATTEVTIYVQSFIDTNPVFKHDDWTSLRPVVKVGVKEELPIDSILFTLQAYDPVMEQPTERFEMVTPDAFGYFSLKENTGEIVLKKRLDYEALNETDIEFSVKATSTDGTRETVTVVRVSVENVNDNAPEFEQKSYRVVLVENSKHPEKVATVQARDGDAVRNDEDRRIGYNLIGYSLSGPDAAAFIINNKTGTIQIAPNQTIDREKDAMLKLLVTAEDAPGKTIDSRRSTVEVLVTVLDVNDNAPMFVQKTYTAVIAENAEVNAFVSNVTATDPDEGVGGEIHYEFLNEGDAHGLLRINSQTGEIRTRVPLTGKGRSEPYEIVVRAQDNGGKIDKQISLFSDVMFMLYIGDVSANDGIPYFIAPKLGQVANITENATIASPVFQVVAHDPDNPSTPSGTLAYRIQDDIEDAKTFRIDKFSGLITTVKPLDRESKAMYRIIVEVTDHGQPPQAATRVLRINVLDIDDHKPQFVRDTDSRPYEMDVLEEQSAGTIVGNLTAIDEDINENGAIDYMFIDGNQEGLFEIERTENNSAIIRSTQRLDREEMASYLLTVKCFKYGTKRSMIDRKSYNSQDLSEIQVLIRVVDIDDHLPEFRDKHPAVGVRLNVPIDYPLITVNAVDVDPDALPIFYQIVNTTFVPQFYKRDNASLGDVHDLFILNNATGEIRTGKSVADFVDGYFEIIIRANNSNSLRRVRHNKVKVFVIRDKSLLRFVFAKPPAEVKSFIDGFADQVQQELKAYDVEFNVLDTQVLTKPDQSLDFTATSSCFQISRHGSVLLPTEMQSIMDKPELKQALLETYAKYSVSAIDSCSVRRSLSTASFMASPGPWLVILAAVIGVLSLAATCTACCLARRYKRYAKRMARSRSSPDSYGAGAPILYAEPIYGPV